MRKRRSSGASGGVGHSAGGHGGGGHDGGGAMRWLLTYADMITLLMAFFIMMYSMSVINLSRFRDVAFSIRSGFGGMMPGQGKSILGSQGQLSIKPSPIPGDTAGVAYQIVKPVQQYVNEAPSAKKYVKVYVDRRGIILSMLSDEIMFDGGRAEIKPPAIPILERIATVIRSLPNDVRVEGHTCNLSTKSDLYPTNWELSTARATNVIRYMIDKEGISPQRLSAAGYADTHPVVPNDSQRHRTRNRRVDFVILREFRE